MFFPFASLETRAHNRAPQMAQGRAYLLKSARKCKKWHESAPPKTPFSAEKTTCKKHPLTPPHPLNSQNPTPNPQRPFSTIIHRFAPILHQSASVYPNSPHFATPLHNSRSKRHQMLRFSSNVQDCAERRAKVRKNAKNCNERRFFSAARQPSAKPQPKKSTVTQCSLHARPKCGTLKFNLNNLE